MVWKVSYPGGQPSYGPYDPVTKYSFRVYCSAGKTVHASFENKGGKGLKSGSLSVPHDVAALLGHALLLAARGEAEAAFEHDEGSTTG